MRPCAATTGTNRLLTALPQREGGRFLADCRSVDLVVGNVLSEVGERVRHVYFPIVGFVSQNTPGPTGARLDVGLIGDEGMLGVSLILGVDVSPLHAVVQAGGPALRMDAPLFRRQLLASSTLLRVLKRYVHVLMEQAAQSAACSRFHVVEARLARLLLMTQDRAHADGFHITHEVLAGRLAVRRAGVSVAATSLQHRNLISYRRGNITILDRSGLKTAACGCYAADNSIYARMLGDGRRKKRIMS